MQTQVRTGRKRQMSEINVVPYIDVMLVLLVIFMITTPLIQQSVKVNLPKTTEMKSKHQNKQQLIKVTVDKRGNLWLVVGDRINKQVDPAGLKIQVAKELRDNPKIPVVVQGDKDAEYGKVVKAMAILQSAGAPSVGLITEPEENGK